LRIGDDLLEPGASFLARGITVDGEPFPEEFPDIPIQCLGANTEKIWWVQEIVEINE
jgi:hypothetical protein